MKEILDEFVKESKELLADCEESLEKCEEGEASPELLEDFAQKIDRIMGSAKSIAAVEPMKSMEQISKITELGKSLGYQSMTLINNSIFPILNAFLLDLVEILEEILDHIDDSDFLDQKVKIIASRLELLLKKFENNPKLQKDLSLLMKDLGLA